MNSKAVSQSQESKADWQHKAFSAVCEFANEHKGEDHVGEEIRAYGESHGAASVEDPRAWGPVLKKAERHGVIEAVGYAPTVSSNGSPKVLWRMRGA